MLVALLGPELESGDVVGGDIVGVIWTVGEEGQEEVRWEDGDEEEGWWEDVKENEAWWCEEDDEVVDMLVVFRTEYARGPSPRRYISSMIPTFRDQ